MGRCPLLGTRKLLGSNRYLLADMGKEILPSIRIILFFRQLPVRIRLVLFGYRVGQQPRHMHMEQRRKGAFGRFGPFRPRKEKNYVEKENGICNHRVVCKL